MKGSRLLLASGIGLAACAVFSISVLLLAIFGNSLPPRAAGAVLLVNYFGSLVKDVLMLVAGVLGIKNRTSPQRAGICVVLGAVLLLVGAVFLALAIAREGTAPCNTVLPAVAAMLSAAYLAGAWRLAKLN